MHTAFYRLNNLWLKQVYKTFAVTIAFILFVLEIVIAQGAEEKQAFNQFTGNLFKYKGQWIAANPGFLPSDKSSAKWIRYSYTKLGHPDSFLLTIQGYKPQEKGWFTILELTLSWDLGKQNVQCSGKDNSGKKYTGESGKLTATELSLDLSGPAETASPSYLRFNQNVTDSTMSISHFKQQADKWLFVEKLDFTPFKKSQELKE